MSTLFTSLSIPSSPTEQIIRVLRGEVCVKGYTGGYKHHKRVSSETSSTYTSRLPLSPSNMILFFGVNAMPMQGIAGDRNSLRQNISRQIESHDQSCTGSFHLALNICLSSCRGDLHTRDKGHMGSIPSDSYMLTDAGVCCCIVCWYIPGTSVRGNFLL